VEIAVVIPALDEAGAIASAIETAQAPAGGGLTGVDSTCSDSTGNSSTADGTADDADLEIVVVDGGSRDDTVERARAMGAEVISGPRGRGRQLDLGWRACSGEVVVFLHADTRLAPGWREAVRAALADDATVGGAFRFRFDVQRPSLRWVEWGVALRTRLFSLPYGDQALFVRRSILEQIGGISHGEMFEDLDLVSAMRARGRIALLHESATTSARRYLESGVLRTVVRNAVALTAWRLGFDPARVAAWYGR
jgi:rSAM/selenodomain-associated transferase 2